MSQAKKMLPLAVLIVIWAIVSQFTKPIFIPTPMSVINTFIELFRSGMLLNSALASFGRITAATMLSALISIPLALLISNYKLLDNCITPITSFMRYIPVTAFYPLLILWVGIEETMKITFLFAATFFSFLPALVLIIKGIDRDLIDTAYTIGMSKTDVILKVQLPYALPSILQSFLTMYSIGWTYVIIAEVTNARFGLGHLMYIGSARGMTDMVFASILVVVLISFIFDNFFSYIIKKAFAWKFAREISD